MGWADITSMIGQSSAVIATAEFPVLTADIATVAPLWTKSGLTYSEWVGHMDQKIQGLCQQGYQVSVRAIDPRFYLVWCLNHGLDQTEETTLFSYSGPHLAVYPYDGDLRTILQLQMVATDLGRVLAGNEIDKPLSLEDLDRQTSDLLARVVLTAAESDGSVLLKACRGPDAPTNGLISGPDLTCELDLVQGTWVTDNPSRSQLLRVTLMLAQACGGRLDLHLFGPEDNTAVRTCTFWLPWGQGNGQETLPVTTVD